MAAPEAVAAEMAAVRAAAVRVLVSEVVLTEVARGLAMLARVVATRAERTVEAERGATKAAVARVAAATATVAAATATVAEGLAASTGEPRVRRGRHPTHELAEGLLLLVRSLLIRQHGQQEGLHLRDFRRAPARS